MIGFRLINKDDNLLHLECMRSNLSNLPAKSAADKVLIQSYFPLKKYFPFSSPPIHKSREGHQWSQPSHEGA